MKKIFTLFIFVLLSLNIFAQNDIPNWSFEVWDSTQYFSPKSWTFTMGRVNPVSSSHSGNWACKIQNDSLQQNPGVILIGKTNNGTQFSGGQPYSQLPDSIKFFIKYKIAPNDSARLVIIFKNSGTEIMKQIEAVAWDMDTSAFHLFECKLNFPTMIIPDTVIVGIVSSDYISRPNGPFPKDNILIVDNVSFVGTNITQQLNNNNFEQWDSTKILTLPGWYTGNNGVPTMKNIPSSIERTTDKTEGNYAVLIQNYISSKDTVRGFAITPGIGANPWDPGKPAFVLSQPFYDISFSFDYQYFPENNDSMTVNVILYHNGNAMGGAYFRSGETVSSWTTVPLLMYFFSLDLPDSAKIYLWAYKSDNSAKPLGNSKLYIDNLYFFFPDEIKTPSDKNNNILIYPNPFNTSTTINYQLNKNENVIIQIVDVLGNEVAVLVNKALPAGNYNQIFDGSHLPKGIYFCHIKVGNNTTIKKIILE